MGGRYQVDDLAPTQQRRTGEPLSGPGARADADEKERIGYEWRRAIAPASLAFFAGAAWGLHETVVHHNAAFFRVFPGASRRYWGPQSWQNKYEQPWYVPVQISDGKHLTATAHHVALFAAGMTITIGERRPVWHYLVDTGVSLVAYSIGNALVYNWIF